MDCKPVKGTASPTLIHFILFSFQPTHGPQHALFYIPADRAQGFQFLHILTNNDYFLFSLCIYIAVILMNVMW